MNTENKLQAVSNLTLLPDLPGFKWDPVPEAKAYRYRVCRLDHDGIAHILSAATDSMECEAKVDPSDKMFDPVRLNGGIGYEFVVWPISTDDTEGDESLLRFHVKEGKLVVLPLPEKEKVPEQPTQVSTPPAAVESTSATVAGTSESSMLKTEPAQVERPRVTVIGLTPLQGKFGFGWTAEPANRFFLVKLFSGTGKNDKDKLVGNTLEASAIELEAGRFEKAKAYGIGVTPVSDDGTAVGDEAYVSFHVADNKVVLGSPPPAEAPKPAATPAVVAQAAPGPKTDAATNPTTTGTKPVDAAKTIDPQLLVDSLITLIKGLADKKDEPDKNLPAQQTPVVINNRSSGSPWWFAACLAAIVILVLTFIAIDRRPNVQSPSNSVPISVLNSANGTNNRVTISPTIINVSSESEWTDNGPRVIPGMPPPIEEPNAGSHYGYNELSRMTNAEPEEPTNAPPPPAVSQPNVGSQNYQPAPEAPVAPQQPTAMVPYNPYAPYAQTYYYYGYPVVRSWYWGWPGYHYHYDFDDHRGFWYGGNGNLFRHDFRSDGGRFHDGFDGHFGGYRGDSPHGPPNGGFHGGGFGGHGNGGSHGGGGHHP